MKERSVTSKYGIRLLALGLFLAVISSGGCKKDPLSLALFDDGISPYIYALLLYPSLSVISTAPADGATDVSVGAAVSVTFSNEMDPATVTVQAADGPCGADSFQVSADNFTTCIGGTVSTTDNTTFSLSPASGLGYDTNYQIRITTSAADIHGASLHDAFITPVGFTTIKLMQPPTDVSASIGYNCLTLTWTNPADPQFSAVRIQRSSSLPYPATPTDGTNVYDGPSTGFSDSVPTGGQPYYYTIFAYDTNNIYSAGVNVTETPQAHKWFTNFAEHASNPVLTSVSQRRYYPFVVYDNNAFGNNIGDDIDGAGSGTDTYTVRPYYKVWVGDGTNTDFLYSDDGINWIEPAVGNNIITGHYHPSLLYNVGGVSGYRMWNWNIGSALDYYTSSDGITWTLDNTGRITQTNNVSPSLPYSAVYELSGVLYEGSTYYGWINSNGHWNMLSSTDAKSWTNLGECTLDISTMTGNYLGTDGRICVLHRNGIYQMWYSSDENGDFVYTPVDKRRYGISYAESSNGRDFTAVNTIDYKGANASIPGPKLNAIMKIYDSVTWRDVVTYSPLVIFDSSKFSGHGESRYYKMYYSGDSSDTVTYPRRSSGYASFDEISCE